jgi:hypothetical protein
VTFEDGPVMLAIDSSEKSVNSFRLICSKVRNNCLFQVSTIDAHQQKDIFLDILDNFNEIASIQSQG